MLLEKLSYDKDKLTRRQSRKHKKTGRNNDEVWAKQDPVSIIFVSLARITMSRAKCLSLLVLKMKRRKILMMIWIEQGRKWCKGLPRAGKNQERGR